MSLAVASADVDTMPRAAVAAVPVVPPLSPTARALLVLVCVELVLLYAPTVLWLVDRWTMSVWHNAHGLLIPFAVGYFTWQELRPLRHAPREASPAGALFLLPAIAMHVLDTGIHTEILSAVSIVVALPGLSLLFLGARRTKAIAFPLLFLAFMLPLPLAMTERIHLVLRHISTTVAAWIIPLLGVTVHAEATSLHLREGILEIGDGCSGFSTLYAACAVAALTAYSCNHLRGRLLALTSAVPLAVMANTLRIVLLVFAVRWLGIGVLETWIHPASGVLTFMLALPAILWLGGPAVPAPGPHGARR